MQHQFSAFPAKSPSPESEFSHETASTNQNARFLQSDWPVLCKVAKVINDKKKNLKKLFQIKGD